jgi:predicted kinase
MLDGGKWSKSNEKYVLYVRDMLILQAMQEGKHVIVDDTNLHPKYEAGIRSLAEQHNAAVEIAKTEGHHRYNVQIKDFTDVDPMECIRRDNARANGVGHEVIMKMYNQFLKPEEVKVQAPEYDSKLPDCIICDIDGTLADNDWRNPFDASEADKDGLIQSTKTIIEMFDAEGVVVVMFSGRDGSFEKPTRKFLDMHEVPFDRLHLRTAGDARKDSIVKREMYEKHVLGKYNVLCVFDDRNQVVDMWRKELGLPCHQVNYGDF